MHDIVGPVLEFLGDVAMVGRPDDARRWLRWLQRAVLIFITLFVLAIVGLIVWSR